VSWESQLQTDAEEHVRLVERSPNRTGTKGIRQLVEEPGEDASTALSLEAGTTTCSISIHHHPFNATRTMRWRVVWHVLALWWWRLPAWRMGSSWT